MPPGESEVIALVERCEEVVGRCPNDSDACAAWPIVNVETQQAIDACSEESCQTLGGCYGDAMLGSRPAE